MSIDVRKDMIGDSLLAPGAGRKLRLPWVSTEHIRHLTTKR
jgi:hypothetical protein